MSATLVAVLTGIASGALAAVVAAVSQRRKVAADAAGAAVEAASVMLQELRAERSDLRARIEHLESQDELHGREIAELRRAERRCQERLMRAVKAMRDGGLDVPPDLIDEMS